MSTTQVVNFPTASNSRLEAKLDELAELAKDLGIQARDLTESLVYREWDGCEEGVGALVTDMLNQITAGLRCPIHGDVIDRYCPNCTTDD